MGTRNDFNGILNRRNFLGGTLAAGAAAAAVIGGPVWAVDVAKDAASTATPAGKPNSVFNGVRVGCITYSYRGGVDTAEYTLECLLKDGLSETELMDGPIRSFAEIGGGRGRGKDAPNPAPRPASDAERAKLRESQLAKCAQLRKMYNDAGVNIHIHKI